MLVTVRDNNVDRAMKILKKKLFNDGVIKELMDRRYYTKPSAKKRRNKLDAIRRNKKEQQKKLEEFGY